MAISKNAQEKNELFKTLWQISNEVRSAGVSSWDFKSYIMNTIFYRYLSEMLTQHINNDEHKSGNMDFDYAELSDDDVKRANIRDEIIKELGFFLYPSELFQNVNATAYKNENLNIKLDEVFHNLENSAKGTNSEKCFIGLFDDFNTNDDKKLGKTLDERNKRLTLLLNRIASVNFGGDYITNSSDVLGDAYEYLMGLYASEAGQKGGEFFTPQEVSELLTKICVYGKTRINKIYDPTCGSGSLLLKSAKILGKDNVDVGYFGQELNSTTYNLCRMNMILHGIPYDKFDIANDDTLTNPMHWDLEPFEAIVSNPPYSIKWVGDNDPTLINDPRFSSAGVLAPKNKADFAFIMHTDAWLAPNGVASIVCFPGIMYRSGAEQKIRKYLIDNNRIDCIIQLPSNLFYGTSIATCIMVMKKNKTDNKVLFIDASKEFHKETKQNRLHEENIDNIMKLYTDRVDVPYQAKLVNYEDIVNAKYNLSVSTYVEKEDTREVIDIKVLNEKIDDIVKKVNTLRSRLEEMVKEIEV